jgi:hypothetical protein
MTGKNPAWWEKSLRGDGKWREKFRHSRGGGEHAAIIKQATQIKKNSKFSSNIRKFRPVAKSYMTNGLLICDFATDPI